MFEKVDIPVDPEIKDGFPEIFSTIILTCGATGIPEPNITWFKDGVQLLGERSRTLVIREVDITDRGLYMCVAKNFNPNNQEDFTVMSDEAVVNIKGKYPSLESTFILFHSLVGSLPILGYGWLS